MGDRVAQAVALGLELLVLVRTGDGGGVDLGHLEAQQVELPGPSAVVAAQVGQRRLDLPELGLGRLQAGQVDVAEAVQRGPLGRTPQQRLVGVLAVEVDQLLAGFAQGRGGGQAAVHVGPAPPVGRDHPPEHDLLVARDEPALDHGLVPRRADQDGIGPPADEQVDRLDQQGLARARLPRQGGHAGAQHQLEPVDDTQVLHRQLDQHQAVNGRRGRTWP